MKILDFYASVLKAANLVVDDQGKVSASMEGMSLPFSVGGKRLVVPTREHMSNPDKSEMVLFHPLKENILTGESDVMARYRQSINTTANYVVGILVTSIVTLAASPAMHGKLSPDQLEIVRIFKDADKDSVTAFKAIPKAMPQGNNEKCFVHIFTKTKAKLNGKIHRRGAIVNFPFYEELIESKTSSVYGVKLRKKDFAAIKAIFELIFPGIENENSYSRGSLSDTVPTLDALLRAMAAIFSCTNDMVHLLKAAIDDVSSLEVDVVWASILFDFQQFDEELRLMPMQAGNEGGVGLVTDQPVAPPAAQPLAGWSAPQQQAPMPPVNQPQVVTPVKKDGKLDIKALGSCQQQQQPTWGQQPQQPQNQWGAWGGMPLPAGWGPALSGPEAARAGGYAGGRYSQQQQQMSQMGMGMNRPGFGF